jgi:hypothetical protein
MAKRKENEWRMNKNGRKMTLAGGGLLRQLKRRRRRVICWKDEES